MEVRQIDNKDCYDLILNTHYAHRIPSISYSYGLFDNGDLIGCCTYGTPASSSLLKGVCGEEYKSIVKELNRLVLKYNRPNEASYLIAQSLKQLPKPMVVVSYADTTQEHIGIVYQATNFIYTGLSAKRTDWKIQGEEHLHGATIADRSRGKENRAEWMRQTYGERFYLADRPRKHRYVYFLGSKVERKRMNRALKYKVLPYPKPLTSAQPKPAPITPPHCPLNLQLAF